MTSDPRVAPLDFGSASLPMRLDARLVALADELTVDIPMPPLRWVEVIGSPAEEVLRCLRATVRADEDADDEKMFSLCRYVGEVKAAQIKRFHGLGARA